MQVAFKGGFSADGDRLALGHHWTVVAAPGGAVHPGAGGLAKSVDEPLLVARSQFAHQADAVFFEFFIRLGANAVDLAAGQRPDFALQVVFKNDGDAIGFVELAGHFGEQLVGCHANRAGQAGVVKNAFLDQPGQHPATFALPARYVGEVDVDLVHTPVFHQRRDLQDDVLEAAREAAVFGKVNRQHDGLRAEFGGFHHAHGRANAKLPRGVSGGGDHAPAHITAQQFKGRHGDVAQVGLAGPLALGVADAQARQHVFPISAAAANHHRQAFELGVTQQLDGRVKGVHVQMRNTPDGWCGRHDQSWAQITTRPRVTKTSPQRSLRERFSSNNLRETA